MEKLEKLVKKYKNNPDKKLNHIELSEIFPKSYDIMKDYFDLRQKNNSTIWMNKDGRIIYVDKNDVFINNFDDRDIIHMFDFFEIYGYIYPEPEGNEMLMSGSLLVIGGKHMVACRKLRNRKAVENLIIIKGLELFEKYINDGTIKYQSPTYETIQN